MKKLAESTWYPFSPFHSPEVYDICEHLTPSEKRDLKDLTARYGRTSGIVAGIFAGLIAVSFSFYHSVTLALVFLILLVLYELIFEGRRFRAQKKRIREMLCDTEYARSRGYHPETLKMFAFPWKK
jgi:uncharacterized membrane protein